MSRALRVYRLTIVSWPTPDGKPFTAQPAEVWEKLVDWHGGNPCGEYPSWLPDTLPLDNWIVPEEAGGGQGGRHLRGALAGWDWLVIPVEPKRVHYFSRATAERHVATYAEWGVVVRMDASEPVVWLAGEVGRG